MKFLVGFVLPWLTWLSNRVWRLPTQTVSMCSKGMGGAIEERKTPKDKSINKNGYCQVEQASQWADMKEISLYLFLEAVYFSDPWIKFLIQTFPIYGSLEMLNFISPGWAFLHSVGQEPLAVKKKACLSHHHTQHNRKKDLLNGCSEETASRKWWHKVKVRSGRLIFNTGQYACVTMGI